MSKCDHNWNWTPKPSDPPCPYCIIDQLRQQLIDKTEECDVVRESKNGHMMLWVKVEGERDKALEECVELRDTVATACRSINEERARGDKALKSQKSAEAETNRMGKLWQEVSDELVALKKKLL